VILLWGLPGDSPLARVRSALCRREATVAFIDQRHVLETEVELRVDGTVQGVVRTPDRVILLDQVTAAYVRPYSSAQLPAVERAGPFSAAWQHAVSIDDAMACWADLAPAHVVNRPAAMATNSAKPYQALFIQAIGFEVPATLVTTDPHAVREFWAEHGTVIYKSLSGVRSIVSRLEDRHNARLDRVRWCPTQFQQYIPGTDYRVHVVGDEVFGCEIRSPADDYRYAAGQGLGVEICPYQLPQDVADRCRALTRSLGLSVTGIDFRRDPEGSWYCFEVNPSPAFTYYQNASDQPIDEAIADLLIRSAA
jgi:glutathione synthase/RimK-type ligase-like ATP-grasp enzyme